MPPRPLIFAAQPGLLPELFADPAHVPDPFSGASPSEPIAWTPAHAVDLRDHGWPSERPSRPRAARVTPPRPAKQAQKATLARELSRLEWRDTRRCLTTVVDLCRAGDLDLQVAEGLDRNPNGVVKTLGLLRSSHTLAQDLQHLRRPTLLVAVVPNRPPTILEDQPFAPPAHEHLSAGQDLARCLSSRTFASLQDRRALASVARLAEDDGGPEESNPRTLVLVSRPLPQPVLRALMVESTLPPVLESPEGLTLAQSVSRPCLSVSAEQDVDNGPLATRLTLGASLLASGNSSRSARQLARLQGAMRVP